MLEATAQQMAAVAAVATGVDVGRGRTPVAAAVQVGQQQTSFLSNTRKGLDQETVS